MSKPIPLNHTDLKEYLEDKTSEFESHELAELLDIDIIDLILEKVQERINNRPMTVLKALF